MLAEPFDCNRSKCSTRALLQSFEWFSRVPNKFQIENFDFLVSFSTAIDFLKRHCLTLVRQKGWPSLIRLICSFFGVRYHTRVVLSRAHHGMRKRAHCKPPWRADLDRESKQAGRFRWQPIPNYSLLEPVLTGSTPLLPIPFAFIRLPDSRFDWSVSLTSTIPAKQLERFEFLAVSQGCWKGYWINGIDEFENWKSWFFHFKKPLSLLRAPRKWH